MNLNSSFPISFLVLGLILPCQAELSDNYFKAPAFESGAQANGVPVGWSLYGNMNADNFIRIVEPDDAARRALLLHDNDPAREIGVYQTVPAREKLNYRASAWVRAFKGKNFGGAYVQLRFLPSNKLYQVGLATNSYDKYEKISVTGTAPPGTTRAVVYLYSHRDPTPKLVIQKAELVSGVKPPPPPPPEPVPPVYTKLKELYLNTELVKGGQPNAVIISPASGLYKQQASEIQETVEQRTGVRLPIETDESAAANVPIEGHRIALGNRSTNKFISRLYDQYYTLLDLKYPGKEGWVVRTLHNPYGNGHNVVFVGGSDLGGVAAGTTDFEKKLRAAGGGKGSLTLGRLMDIQLGKGIHVPTDIRDFRIWEASRGYRSTGYFGWNSISKRMAMYYMTGDEFQAREAIRLAFPDAQAKKEISEIDGERIENKDDPLAGPYHYNAHMTVLFWDLIEESPVFTDEERLKVTNAFSRQLDHRKGEHIYGLTTPSRSIGSRHGQWAAISIYCLGRYFQKDYPNPIWYHCVRGALMHFASLHKYAWVAGENDNLFWYNTGIAPLFTYLTLTGDRAPLENGTIRTVLKGLDILISGRDPDWALHSASIGFLNKAAYLTRDGRYVLYRNRTGVDTNIFRLGQSFWPEEDLKPAAPNDLVGKWTLHRLSKPKWRARNSGLKFDESFEIGSFRDRTDASGDFVLLDGFNGASRNPYHTFDILELRIRGATLLKGYMNQVLTKADGMVEQKIAMNAALKFHDVIGGTAAAAGEVPNAAFCNWRRTLAQRIGRYALVVDDLAFRSDSENIDVAIHWETESGARRRPEQEGVLRLPGALSPQTLQGWLRFKALQQKCTSNLAAPKFFKPLAGIGIMLLRSNQVGDWVELPFFLDAGVKGEVFADLLNYKDRGLVDLYLDGKKIVAGFDHQSDGVLSEKVSLGKHSLRKGKHRLRLVTAGIHPEVGRCYAGLAGLSIRPDGTPPAPPSSNFRIQLCDPAKTIRRGRHSIMQWHGATAKGQHRIFFSLIGPETSEKANTCLRLDDHSAALTVPQKAIATVGKFRECQGRLVLLAEDHLFGIGLQSAGMGEILLTCEPSAQVDWDFTAGRLAVVAEKPVSLSLKLRAGSALSIDGLKHEPEPGEGGRFRVALSAGRHELDGALLPEESFPRLKAGLGQQFAQAEQRRSDLSPDEGKLALADLSQISPFLVARPGGRTADLKLIPELDGTPLIAMVEGKEVHLFDLKGKEVQTLEADGTIRMIRWWKEQELLLAGCADEQVIAFDRSGKRRWVFTSEMHPAVFRAAKTYWFKSAPGHEGIHGLFTGQFLEGKSQVFVGSACTLEILDERGKLLHRMPQFWGKVSDFNIVDGPDGSLNLLASRKYNGTNTVAIINNRTLDPKPRGFYAVPPGHTYVGGWSSMNRHHLFYDDLDGDGVKEVMSEINGSWNRVTVWDKTGKPLYDASFGPGDRIPAKNMRDIDVGDLDGDGKKEIVTGLSSGLVVTLDCQCRKVWSFRLQQPPITLKVFAKDKDKDARIILGCQNGEVLVLDGAGKPTARGKTDGRPLHVAGFMDSEGNRTVILATDKGAVAGFKL